MGLGGGRYPWQLCLDPTVQLLYILLPPHNPPWNEDRMTLACLVQHDRIFLRVRWTFSQHGEWPAVCSSGQVSCSNQALRVQPQKEVKQSFLSHFWFFWGSPLYPALQMVPITAIPPPNSRRIQSGRCDLHLNLFVMWQHKKRHLSAWFNFSSLTCVPRRLQHEVLSI